MSLNAFLRRLILVGLFLVPAIPLIVASGMFFPFITGKNFVFRVIIEVILAAWVILSVRDGEYRPKKSLILSAFAVFLGVIALADIFGENSYRSFWSNYERMEGLISLLHLFAYFLVAVSVLRAEKLWQRLFFTSFGVNAAIVVFSSLQLYGKLAINQGGVRVDATLGNATYLAAWLLFHIFLIVFYLWRGARYDSSDHIIFPALGAGLGGAVALYSILNPSGVSGWVPFMFYALFLALGSAALVSALAYLWRGRFFLTLLLLADLIILYKTETRGAILGLVGGVLLTLVLLAIGNWRNKTIRTAAVSSLAGLIILIGLFIAFRDARFIKNSSTLSRFASISLNEGTTKSRFTIWHMSWEGFKAHPVLGWGQDNFIVVFGKYYEPSMWSQEPWFDRSHNVFFDWLIAGGALGLLAYLALFGAALRVLWRNGQFSFNERCLLTGLLAAHFGQNLFVFDNLTSYILFFSVLGFISVVGSQSVPVKAPAFSLKGSPDKPDQGPDSPLLLLKDGSSYFAVPLALGLLIFVLYFADGKPVYASRTLINAIRPQNDFAVNLGYLKKVFDLNTFGSGEAREQLIQLAVQLRNKPISAEQKQDLFNLTVREMERQVKMAPTDVRYELYFGSFLNAYGLADEALKHLERARELSPKKQMVLFELGSVYLNKGEFEKALPYFKEAYDEAPEYGEAAIVYATGLIYAGRAEEADAVLTKRFETVFLADNRLLSAYAATHRYDRIIAVLLKDGRRDEAVSILEELIKQNPSFKSQGEALISQIRAGQNP